MQLQNLHDLFVEQLRDLYSAETQLVQALPEMAEGYSDSMDNIAAIDKQVLVERHLISREHAAKNVGSGVVINGDLAFLSNFAKASKGGVATAGDGNQVDASKNILSLIAGFFPGMPA